MVDSSTPWQILSQARPSLPQLMGAVQETRRGRLAEMMLHKQMEREERQEQTRAKATELYRGGDRKAAREEAIAGGDFDLAGALGKLGEEEANAVKMRAEAIGNVAQWADSAEKWDQGVDFLVAQGYQDLAQFKGKFTPEARMSALASAGQIKDYYDRTKPVNMSPGGRLVDPTTGRVIAEAPFAPRAVTVGEGQTVVEYAPGTGGSISGYDTVLGNGRYGQPPTPLTGMTIDQAIDFGKNVLIPNSKAAGVGRDSRGLMGSSAMGAYQITQSTLQEFAPQVLGPDWRNQQFTPEVQDAIAEAIFNSTGRDPAKLQARWASLSPQEAAEVARMPWEQASRVIAEGESGGGSRVIAQGAPKPSKQWRTMTPQEAEQRGLPAGVWQEGPNGEIKPVSGATGKNAPQNKEAYSQSAMDAFDRAISSADRLMNHPGFSTAVGMKGPTGGLLGGWVVPGTDAADFRAELEAMKAQVFLPMVQSMKGMGALSNAEGDKLTASIGALDPNMSESGFKASLNRIVADLNTYKRRAAGGGTPRSPAPKSTNKPSVSNW